MEEGDGVRPLWRPRRMGRGRSSSRQQHGNAGPPPPPPRLVSPTGPRSAAPPRRPS